MVIDILLCVAKKYHKTRVLNPLFTLKKNFTVSVNSFYLKIHFMHKMNRLKTAKIYATIHFLQYTLKQKFNKLRRVKVCLELLSEF